MISYIKAYVHNDIRDVINRSRIRTAADNIKSTSYDDSMLDSFIASVCEIADDYDRKFCVPRTRGGWSNL
jgi:hypothetical protein